MVAGLTNAGLPGGSEVKVSACNVGDLGSIPRSGRSPGEGNGNPLQYSCLENLMDGGAWWATVHGVANSWTLLSDFTSLHFMWRSRFLGIFFSGGDLEFMVTSARDLHRDKGGRMKTQRTRNLVTWDFLNRGFFFLNFSVEALLSYWEESLAYVFPEKCPVTSKSGLTEPKEDKNFLQQ